MFRLDENIFTGTEDELVKLFIERYKSEYLVFGDNYIYGEYFEQVRIKEIKRVSDLIIRCGDSRLINIEFKLGDYGCVQNQATDHLKWCDYSYVCVPINWLRVYPKSFCEYLLSKGIGLIVGSGNGFVEVFRAKHNTYKKGKLKELRLKVLGRLKTIQQV